MLLLERRAMKIVTRKQLITAIAQRIYDDACINDLEQYSDAYRDWKNAEKIVSFFFDEAGSEPAWAREHIKEDYSKFNHFIRNYEENATDRVTQ
jgi:hypothetical protein